MRLYIRRANTHTQKTINDTRNERTNNKKKISSSICLHYSLFKIKTVVVRENGFFFIYIYFKRSIFTFNQRKHFHFFVSFVRSLSSYPFRLIAKSFFHSAQSFAPCVIVILSMNGSRRRWVKSCLLITIS